MRISFSRYDKNLTMLPHQTVFSLLCLAFDQQKNANHDSQKETALRMCDRHSGLDRISHIERLNEEDPLEPELRGLLRELQIDKGRECLQVHASGTYMKATSTGTLS